MKSWKRSLMMSTTLLATLAVSAGVLQVQVSAANLEVRSEGRSLPLKQPSPALPAITPQSFSATQPATLAQNRALTIEDFTVESISLRSTEAQVREWLGTPESVEDNRESLNGIEIYSRYLYYNRNGIHGVGLAQDPATGEFIVRHLLVKGPESRTAAGMGVGDSAQKLLDTYGPPERIWNQGDTMDYWYYYSSELGMELQFTVLKNGDSDSRSGTHRISEITLSRINPLTRQTSSFTSQKADNITLAQASRPPLTIQQVEIGGISSSFTEGQIRQQLGTPIRAENDYWECCGNIRTLTYADSEVKLIEGATPGRFTVFSFTTTRPDLATRDGIRPGDSQQKVLDTYGTPQGTRTEAGTTTLFYILDEYATSLSFHIHDGKVIAVSFFVELN